MKHRRRPTRSLRGPTYCAWLRPSRLRSNGTWRDYVRGEWWVMPGEGSTFADRDVGDVGHDELALEAMFSPEELVDAIVASLQEEDDDPLPEFAKRLLLNISQGHEYTSAELYYTYHNYISDTQGAMLLKGNARAWRDLKDETPKYVYVKYYGAIRVINASFEVWNLTTEAIRAMQDHFYELIEWDELVKSDSPMEIEELSTHNYTELTIDQFMLAKHPRDVWGN